MRADHEDFLRIRYLCLIVRDEYLKPEMGDASLSTVKFTPGRYQGRALCFDLEQGELIGGRVIDVTNSSKIDFKSGIETEARAKGADNAVERDLRDKINEIVRAP